MKKLLNLIILLSVISPMALNAMQNNTPIRPQVRLNILLDLQNAPKKIQSNCSPVNITPISIDLFHTMTFAQIIQYAQTRPAIAPTVLQPTAPTAPSTPKRKNQ